MVVPATAIVSRDGADTLAQRHGIGYVKYKFYNEYHPKLKPVETVTGGIYLAGTCMGPIDIPESVAQGSRGQQGVSALFCRPDGKEPITSVVNKVTCNACWDCVTACPYSAIERDTIKNRQGTVVGGSQGQRRRLSGLRRMRCGLQEQVDRPEGIY